MVLFHGVEVNILVNGRKARELEDRFDRAQPPSCHHFTARYIKVQPDDRYEIQTKVSSTRDFPANPGFESLQRVHEIDGHRVGNQYTDKYPATDTFCGALQGSGSDLKRYPFIITSLESSRNSTPSRDLEFTINEEVEQRFHEKIGTISVRVYRCGPVTRYPIPESDETDMCSALRNQNARPHGQITVATG